MLDGVGRPIAPVQSRDRESFRAGVPLIVEVVDGEDRSRGAKVVGVAQSGLSPYSRVSAYRSAAPFVLAIVALLYLSRRRVVTMSRTAG